MPTQLTSSEGTVFCTNTIGNYIVERRKTMGHKPAKVEIYHAGELKVTLTDSYNGSLNDDKPEYNGKSDYAVVYGPKGSVVTFFDDKQFKTRQNYVVITTLDDGPVEVMLSMNFVNTDSEAGDGVYVGQKADYKFALFKRVKSDWFTRNIPIDLENIAYEGINLGKALTVGRRSSKNYRVDNCSSVRFGD